jgi:hypothetical protein
LVLALTSMMLGGAYCCPDASSATVTLDVIVTCARTDTLLSVESVAVIVTVEPLGTSAGAV